MKDIIVSTILYIIGGTIALLLAYFNGKKAERIRQQNEQAKQSAKEQDKKNEIENNVANMSDDDVANRLQDISSKQR